MLVDFQKAEARLRTGEHEQYDLVEILQDASDIVLTYIKRDESYFEGEIPRAIQSATLLVAGELLKEKEAGSNPLSQGVIDILTPYRDPTMA